MIRYGILPVDEYCSPRVKYIPEKKIFLSESLRMYHAMWTSGVEAKRCHLKQVLNLVQENILLKRLYFFVAYYSVIFRYPTFFFRWPIDIIRDKYQNLSRKIDIP